MDLNADLSVRALVHASLAPWTPSPAAGVERRMLDRIGDEVARATTVVRYAPGTRFTGHTHHGGEEFLVLEGVFQDEHGDYPAGTYVRNPPGTSHAPGAAQGAVILVKLRQFEDADRTAVVVDSNAVSPVTLGAGVSTRPLHHDANETVRLETWAAGTAVRVIGHGGYEAFVLEGALSEGGDQLVRHSWLRLPPGTDLEAVAGPAGATLWVKSGHLRSSKPLPRSPTRR
jgi:anti-sigma factor ChrR (cupin superfamily)